MNVAALKRGMVALSVIGLGVAIYLTYVHYSGIQPVCTAGGSCIKVQTSVWSRLAGVPVALVGLIGYIAILASLLFPEREETRLATLGLTLVGFGFSAYLTYRELFSIHAICEWCASSAVIMTLLFAGSVTRYLLAPGGPGVAGAGDGQDAAGAGEADDAAEAGKRRPTAATFGTRSR